MTPRMGGYTPSDHKTRHQDGGRDEISLASLSGVPAALTTHEAAIDIHVGELYAHIMAEGHPLTCDLTFWSSSLSNGAVKQTGVTFNGIGTESTQNASGIIYAYMTGFNIGGSTTELVDWDKKLRILMCISIRDMAGNHSDSIYHVQLKEAITEGALGAKGIGLRIDGVTAAPQDLFAESYGISLAATDLGVNMVDRQNMWIEIIHTPATSIVWKVNGVTTRTETDTNKIPSGLSGTAVAMCVSAINGTSSGDGRMYLSNLFIWQEK